MEYVVSENNLNVIIEKESIANVQTDVVQTIVVEPNSGNILTQGDTSTIVVEAIKQETVLAGMVGPRGETAEDADVYSKRLDVVSDSVTYKGEAPVGSLEASAVWRIRKYQFGVDGDVTELWADGSALFDKIWGNRVSYSYS